MKRPILLPMLGLLLMFLGAQAQEDITVVATSSEAAEGLDLHAVAELFKDCENLEQFERKLNDPDLGINNLDLNADGYVDFIRVVEDVNKYSHLIILQAALGENEFQDVATIEIERDDDDTYRMHICGSEVIYGPNYYFVPTYVHFHTWPIIVWIYRPIYRPYRSVYYFRYYPHWYRPYPPVPVHIYRPRVIKYYERPTFVFKRTPALTVTHRVVYKPTHSVLVKKQTTVIHKTGSESDMRRPTRAGDGVKMEAVKTREVKRTDEANDHVIHNSHSESMKKSGGKESAPIKSEPRTSKKSNLDERSAVKKSQVKKIETTKGERSTSTVSKRRDLGR